VELYFLADAFAARGRAESGNLNSALYDLASDVTLRVIPKEAKALVRQGVPVVDSEGNVFPKNEELFRLFHNIPDVDSNAREDWYRAVVSTIHKHRDRP